MDIDPQQVRERLAAECRALAEQLENLARSFDGIVAATRDANTDDEHDPEGATIAFERSMVSSVARSAEEHLQQIEAALQRLDDGTYGQCRRCGGDIGAERLEARPAAELCIGCASR